MVRPAGRPGPTTARPAARPVAGQGLALGAALAAGALIAVQQRLNGELRQGLDDVLLTTTVSFGLGLVCVLLVVLGRTAAREAVARLADTTWWERLGGLGGAVLVAVSAAAAPVLGVALLTVALVAGQTVGGLVVDRLGVAPGGRHVLTGPRVAGALVCLVAVAVSLTGGGARDAEPLLLALIVVTGFVTAVQQALNGRVHAVTGDAMVTTALNFVVGAAALVALLAGQAAVQWLTGPGPVGLAPQQWPGAGQWHLYLGGPLGVVFVAVAATAVRALGVLRLGLALVAGQLVGAVLLDTAVPAPGAALSASTAAGAALTLVAVAVSGHPPRQPRRPVAP